MSAPPLSEQRSCPQCDAAVPASPGYVEWCPRCGWNVEGPAPLPLPAGRFAYLLGVLGRRSGERLAQEARAASEPRRGWSSARALAYVIAAGVLALDAALLLGGVALVVAGFPDFLSILLGVTLISVGIAMRPQLFTRDEGGELDPAAAPVLHEQVARIAAAVGVRPPDGIALDGDWNAGWAVVGFRRRRRLILGLPLWTCLEPQERVALIAHELGHERASRLRDIVLWPALGALDRLSAVLRPPEGGFMLDDHLGPVEHVTRALMAVVALPVDGVLWVQAHLLLRDLQREEYLADAYAARAAGNAAVITLHERLLLHPTFAHAVERAATGAGEADDVLARIRAAVADVPDHERERRHRAARLQHTRLTDTHPPTATRIALLQDGQPTGPAVWIDGWTSERIDAELAPSEPAIARELVDRFRGALYFG